MNIFVGFVTEELNKGNYIKFRISIGDLTLYGESKVKVGEIGADTIKRVKKELNKNLKAMEIDFINKSGKKETLEDKKEGWNR